MIKGLEAILLSSENAKELSNFFKDKVGLKLSMEAEMGDHGEKVFGFDLGGGPNLYIFDHSKVKGKSSNPERVMFNLEVDDIEEEVKKLEKAGVKKVQDIYHVQDYGYIATFEDSDGNYFQLVKTRE
ncbi:VOC family protein [Candidatus Daviesbacteria bacterium]|nr:VOC family protein [Candidatus Daviesbacteria bacterium]